MDSLPRNFRGFPSEPFGGIVSCISTMSACTPIIIENNQVNNKKPSQMKVINMLRYYDLINMFDLINAH